jgi:hypothetical protein
LSGQPEAPAIPGVTRWRRKTVEVAAIQRTAENLEAIRKFAGPGRYMTEPDGTLRILVSSGWRRVNIGWWVGREDGELFVDTGYGLVCDYERVPDPLVMPADEFAAVKTVRERLGEALDASIVGCARCKVCDTQIGAAMTVLGPLLARAEAAEAKLAAIRVSARDSGRIVAAHPDDGTYAAKEISFAAGQSRSLAEIIAAFEHSNHLDSKEAPPEGPERP